MFEVYLKMNRLPFYLCCPLLAAGLCAQSTWTGGDATNPSYFGDSDNWTGGVPNFPNYQIYPTGPTQQTIEMVNAGGASLFRTGTSGINFETAGYVLQDTVGDGSGGIRYDFNGTVAATGGNPFGVNSQGAGVNEFAARFQISSSDTREPDSGQPVRPITVGTGNTLLFSGTFEVTLGFSLLGDGRMIVNNTNINSGSQFNAGINIPNGATLLNRGSMVIGPRDISLISGVIGGDGHFNAYANNYDVVFAGTTLAPGGDGTTLGGPEAGVMTWVSSLDGQASSLSIGGASTFEAYIGPGGTSDLAQLFLDLNGGTLDLESGSTLNIVGSTIQDGTYVIISDIGDSNPFTGTFSNVLFNGIAADPSNITVNYNDDFVSVDVTGLVPEPSTYALMAGLACGAIVFWRRRR